MENVACVLHFSSDEDENMQKKYKKR